MSKFWSEVAWYVFITPWVLACFLAGYIILFVTVLTAWRITFGAS